MLTSLFILMHMLPILPSGSFFSTFNASFFWINFSILHAFLNKNNYQNNSNRIKIKSWFSDRTKTWFSNQIWIKSWFRFGFESKLDFRRISRIWIKTWFIGFESKLILDPDFGSAAIRILKKNLILPIKINGNSKTWFSNKCNQLWFRNACYHFASTGNKK